MYRTGSLPFKQKNFKWPQLCQLFVQKYIVQFVKVRWHNPVIVTVVEQILYVNIVSILCSFRLCCKKHFTFISAPITFSEALNKFQILSKKREKKFD